MRWRPFLGSYYQLNPCKMANTMLSPSRSLSIYDSPSLTFSCSHFNLQYSVLKPHHIPDRQTAQLNTLSFQSPVYALSRLRTLIPAPLVYFALQSKSLSWCSKSLHSHAERHEQAVLSHERYQENPPQQISSTMLHLNLTRSVQLSDCMLL